MTQLRLETGSPLSGDTGEAPLFQVPALLTDWCVFIQTKDPYLHRSIGPNYTILIGWSCCPDWYFANEAMAMQLLLDRAGLSPRVEMGF